MRVQDLARQVDTFLSNKGIDEGIFDSDLTGLKLIRNRQPSTFETTIYAPLLCLILQGSKETVIGQNPVRFSAGQSLVVSHELPVVARVTEACFDCPYLALVLMLDLSIVRSLYEEVSQADLACDGAAALNVRDCDEALIDALSRLFATEERPVEVRVLVPLLLREIHFRLLMTPHGAMLRQLLRHDSHASRIGKAIAHIKENYNAPIASGDLSRICGMSTSSFHAHFKSVTKTTPLQYQKELRLLEARRQLQFGTDSVAATAFAVGYESATQFSREYSRKFGLPPRAEFARARTAV